MTTETTDQGAERGESACRALVAIGPVEACAGSSDRPLAGFLAQLIANDRRLPAYRKARLAEPAEATGRYARIGQAAVSLVDCVV